MIDTLEHYRKYLVIDKDDLDKCLMEQPETYYHVSYAFAQAVAERDATKLDLEELQAKLGLDLRAQAIKDDEKLTEGSLQQKLTTMPKIQDLQRLRLEKTKNAESWQVLKEAFQQRSFMLRELVALYIAQRHDQSMEAGAGQARNSLAERVRVDAGKLRQAKRLSR